MTLLGLVNDSILGLMIKKGPIELTFHAVASDTKI